MNYEQLIQSQIRWHERVLADIMAGRVFWCESCECWTSIEERRPDPWGSDWPVCADCLPDSGLEGNLLDSAEAEEEELRLRSEGE